ncbi:MAG: RNA polymerase factor sigma-54 [Bacteroidota bacterium]
MGPKLIISQQQRLQLKLSPQQVQYLKLLQLPVLALEQRIKTELDLNPLLEESVEEEMELATQQEGEREATTEETTTPESKAETDGAEEGSYTIEDFMNDDSSGFKAPRGDGNEEREEIPTPAGVSMAEYLMGQLRLLDLTDEELILGDEIIGDIDEDGYLRRDLSLILHDVQASDGLSFTPEKAEEVLQKILYLDPPGIGSRSLQECLTVQLKAGNFDPATQPIALMIVEKYYEEFTMKHYEEIARKLNISMDALKGAVELIQRLNPKPGEGEFTPAENYIVPDFLVQNDDGEFIIILNDRNVPPLRVNKAYQQMIAGRRKNNVSSEAKDFIRKKFEAAKWFIASIHQRRETMMNVMRAIIQRQREFFETGENLKPLIYKDIAEMIGMDISTISRVVNGKYVQTEYGVFSLRHFFGDSIPTVTGEEISNKEVKKKIREIIDVEEPHKPLSDDRIAEMLNKEGLNIARRTVAKYREQMMIPVARLRRKI